MRLLLGCSLLALAVVRPVLAQDAAAPGVYTAPVGAMAPPDAADASLSQAPATAGAEDAALGVGLKSDASLSVAKPVASDGLIDGDAAALAAANIASSADASGAVPDTSLDPNALASVQARDPELGAILASTVLPKADLSLRWDESASRDFYSSTLGLRWRNTLGDYGSGALGSATIPDVDRQITVSIPVTGNDFYLLNSGAGIANFLSRFGSATLGPVLIVNGTVKYKATRDVALSGAQSAPLTGQKLMNDRNAMLIAFDNYTPKVGDRAVLQLTSTTQYGAHTITVYPPDIARVFPTIDATQDATVIADFRPADFQPSSFLTNTNDVVTAYWENLRLSSISKIFKLPAAQEYFMTTMIRLHSDWSNQGGKLPGLVNTGQLDNLSGPLATGEDCTPAGWGGRSANGCRWSARTGWSGRVGYFVGLHTYYYALVPNYGWGYIQNWPTPAPVNQWFAYVERVRVNTPGQADGRLSYWLCTQAGCNAQFDRQDIKFRNADVPQALINEAWADVYCGGLGCPGPNPWPRSTIDLKRMTVTVGLPDMGALAAEVQTLNAGK
jgi:hypothetical protein